MKVRKAMTNSDASSKTCIRSLEDSANESEDAFCGEPLVTQRLTLDFTPSELDTDFVQKKCCDFWDFIYSCTDLQGTMFSPVTESPDVNVSCDSASDGTSSGGIDSVQSIPCERTALSMLEFVESKGLIDRTFEARLPQTQCSLGSREYLNEKNTQGSSQKEKHVCKCTNTCKVCKRQSTGIGPSSSFELKGLCSMIETWDTAHPKCMDPPGHPPALTHCVMQRNII